MPHRKAPIDDQYLPVIEPFNDLPRKGSDVSQLEQSYLNPLLPQNIHSLFGISTPCSSHYYDVISIINPILLNQTVIPTKHFTELPSDFVYNSFGFFHIESHFLSHLHHFQVVRDVPNSKDVVRINPVCLPPLRQELIDSFLIGNVDDFSGVTNHESIQPHREG